MTFFSQNPKQPFQAQAAGTLSAVPDAHAVLRLLKPDDMDHSVDAWLKEQPEDGLGQYIHQMPKPLQKLYLNIIEPFYFKTLDALYCLFNPFYSCQQSLAGLTYFDAWYRNGLLRLHAMNPSDPEYLPMFQALNDIAGRYRNRIEKALDKGVKTGHLPQVVQDCIRNEPSLSENPAKLRACLLREMNRLMHHGAVQSALQVTDLNQRKDAM